MSGFEPFVPSQEFIDQKPFVIRGHHLTYFITLLRDLPFEEYFVVKQANPAEQAKSRRNILESFRSGRAHSFIEGPEGTYDLVQELVKYGQDILGSSKESAENFEIQTEQIFEAFLSLPENYPADIVEGIPDIICGTCVIGKHCHLYHYDLKISQDDAVKGDGEDLDSFLNTLQDLHLPQPTIVSQEAHFSDAEPQIVRRIKTTMGIVRKVLRDGDLKLLTDSVVQ